MWLVHFSYLFLLTTLTTSKEINYYNQLIHLSDEIFKDNDAKSITLVDLRACEIETISSSAFANMTNIQKLLLQHNNICFLSEDVFHSLESVTYLRLDSNLLTMITGNIFSKLKRVGLIDLSYNLISYLEPGIFDKNTKLTRLDLHFNKLKLIPTGLLNSLKKLEYLDISNNHITYIHEYALPSSIKNFRLFGNRLSSIREKHLQSVTRCTLDKNPWICDCHLQKVHAKWKKLYSNQEYWPPTCYGPEKLKDIKWNKLESQDFICDEDNGIYLENADMFVLIGESINLNCFVEGNINVSNVIFTYDNNTEVASHLEKTNRSFNIVIQKTWCPISETYNGLNYTLTILDAQPLDSGNYKCTKQNVEISTYKKFSVEVNYAVLAV